MHAYVCGCSDRAWRTGHNGIKRVTTNDESGFFIVVNLLGPRSPSSRPIYKRWYADITTTQLRYDFIHGGHIDDVTGRCNITTAGYGRPLTIGRTFMTFYDFDTSVVNADAALEVLHAGPQAALVELPSPTSIEQVTSEA